jgi:UDP-3-O-[3-hydroxymyristoyl] glucosamine N-acyltransferase
MSLTLGQIAEKIGADLLGDSDLVINGLASLEDAKEGELSFIASRKFRKQLETTGASALIAYKGLESKKISLLTTKEPYLGFARAMRLFYRSLPKTQPGIGPGAQIFVEMPFPQNIHIGPNAIISNGVQLGEGTSIGAGTFVGENSILGNNCYIFPNVTIRENVIIGNNVVIYPNAVIGSDGFSYCWDGAGHLKIPQAGTVVIEDDVEIGAGTTIDRATLGKTVIGKGTIIDNLVQIGHNSKIGEYSVICAQVGLAGTSTLGRRVTLAGQVGIAGHLTIGDNALLLAQSGVAADIPKGAVYFGSPARDAKTAYKINAILGNLPEYVARIRKLEAHGDKD